MVLSSPKKSRENGLHVSKATLKNHKKESEHVVCREYGAQDCHAPDKVFSAAKCHEQIHLYQNPEKGGTTNG